MTTFYIFYHGRRTNLTVEAADETKAADRARVYARDCFWPSAGVDPNEIRVSRHEPKYDTPHAGAPFRTSGGDIDKLAALGR